MSDFDTLKPKRCRKPSKIFETQVLYFHNRRDVIENDFFSFIWIKSANIFS